VPTGISANEKAVKIGLVGCGFMGNRHLNGFEQLYRRRMKGLELKAVCDLDRERAEYTADLAGIRLGSKPSVYQDFEEMLIEEQELDAVDIVVDPSFHHVLGDTAFRAGKHVIVEKPMAVTVKACRRMVESSKKYDRILAVAENYRRDPINRLVKLAVEEEVIGEPFMVLQNLIGGGGRIAIAPWRHMKERGGILIDMGVHYADLFHYLFGSVESVYGELRLFEHVRKGVDRTGWPSEAQASESHGAEEIKPSAEDTALAILKFENGVLGHLMISVAGHGERLWQRTVFGSEGRIDAPLDRSGKPVSITLDGERSLSGDNVLQSSGRFPYEDLTTKFFPEGLTHYNLPFQETDSRLIAIELCDFAEALIHGRKPEVDASDGLKAVVLTYAICESSFLNEPVRIEDVESGKIREYQQEIDEAYGID